MKDLERRISRLEEKLGAIGITPEWAYRAALQQRNSRLILNDIFVDVFESANKIAIQNGEEPQPLPPEPAFGNLAEEAREIFERHRTEAEYEAFRCRPLSPELQEMVDSIMNRPPEPDSESGRDRHYTGGNDAE